MLSRKKVIVIGGSRGTGLAIVKALLEEAASVLVVGRSAEGLAAVKSIFPSVGLLHADITNEDTVIKVFQESPDVIVLAAGAVPPTRPLYDLDWETFSGNWNTDVKAAFLLTKHALNTPVKPGLQLLFISSGAAIVGSPISGGYAGAKRMQMLLANYAQEAANRLGLHLRFITIAPLRLMHDTGTGAVVIPGYASYLGISEHDFYTSMTLPQTKEDVAKAVVTFAAAAPRPEKGNVFIVSGKGIIQEKDIQRVLMLEK